MASQPGRVGTQALIDAAGSVACDICLGKITVGDDSVSGEFDTSVWAENESINHINDLGNIVRQSKKPKTDHTGPGADGGTLTIVTEKGERAIELLHDLASLRFTKYQQLDPFELPVATKHSLKHSTVEVFTTGHLMYTFRDGNEKPVKVPLGAKPNKFWCEICGGLGRCGRGRTLSEE